MNSIAEALARFPFVRHARPPFNPRAAWESSRADPCFRRHSRVLTGPLRNRRQLWRGLIWQDCTVQGARAQQFETYMERLLMWATRLVVIYSSNHEEAWKSGGSLSATAFLRSAWLITSPTGACFSISRKNFHSSETTRSFICRFLLSS